MTGPDPTSSSDGDHSPASQDVAEARSKIHDSLQEAFKTAGVDLPPDKRRVVVNLLAGQAEATFQGPLPPPGLLEQYNTVLPGLAQQITEMARAEQKHRHRWETQALLNTVFTQSGGLLLGWLLAAGCAGAYAALIAYHYSAWAAAPLLGPPILTIIKTMLPGGRPRASEEGRSIQHAHDVALQPSLPTTD